MKDFWKNEWELFRMDLNNVKEFLNQPIELTLWGKSDLMLKPSVQEIEEKAEVTGFWANEWNLFMQDLNNAKDFLTQPVTFK